MLQQVLPIARTTLIEALRQPVVFLLVMLSGLFQLLNTWNTGFSMSQEESSQVVGDTKLLFDIGLATVFVLGAILAGFIATAVMSREIENKTVLTIVSKPVGRPTLIVGKYLGVAGAVLISVAIMLVFLLMGIRHGVMSTAADQLDGPVLAFTLGGVGLAVLLAAWCNFFYGWNFPQTAVLLLLPLMLAAYAGVLFFAKGWKIQSPTVDLKDQVLVACAALTLAILVLTAVATAASVRLGQVMTIVVCLGVFLAALLSNHLVGRRVFSNTPLGVVREAIPEDASKPTFAEAGDTYLLNLVSPADAPPAPRSALYYSATPNGYPMMTLDSSYGAFTGDLANPNDLLGPTAAPSIIVVESTRQSVTVRNVGATPIPVARPPQKGDYLFTQPTRINAPALAVWGAVPNLQFFWLLDAVSQNRPVPLRYLAMAAAYAAAQIGVFLSIAVLVFQRRDVG